MKEELRMRKGVVMLLLVLFQLIWQGLVHYNRFPPVQSSLCYFDYNLSNRKFIVKTLLKILFLCFCLMLVIYFVCRLMEEPAAYGKLGLANLLELREECLREFQFVDAYRSIKQRYTIVLSLFYLEFFLCSLFLRN